MKRKLINLAMVLAAVFCCVIISGISAKAESVREIEPNDTREQAQTIQANNETISGAYTGTYKGQYTLNGSISRTDQAWFKVYLTAGVNYITCNGSSYNYHIEDDNGNYITGGTYVKPSFGSRAYSFRIETDGTYYVNLVGQQESSTDFIMSVGTPTYSVNSCKINALNGSVTMTKGVKNTTAVFDGTALGTIPMDAVAYSVTMNGVRSTAVNGINLVNNTKGTSLVLSTYTWSKDGIGALKLPVASRWTATFTYSKNITFTPVLSIQYAYPVYSTMVR